MNILDSKEKVITEIDNIFKEYQNLQDDNLIKEKEWIKEKDIIHQTNTRLINEVADLHKKLSLNDKKFLDYEMMINKIQDDALKEVDEKTKHDMLNLKCVFFCRLTQTGDCNFVVL